MAFPENFINDLMDRSDIVDVVSSYVSLTKRSGSNLFGLCPFHSERTPSFSVNPDKQIYHCFGCGKGGGVVNFIMEIENLSYPDAIAFLANRAGMTLPEQNDSRDSRKRSRLFALNKDAARFFYEQLSTDAGQTAVKYMQERQISPGIAKRFGIGYAPNSWDSLEKAMLAKGYTDLDLFDAGLVRKGKSSGWYDTFRNRLMFPVIDVRSSVIGFSGRILGDGEPKYMNSPESMLFNKSRNLFALNLAKRSKSGYIILSEGNIDVVSLHQAGFDSAVASLGTSLTPEQARLISRYTNQVIIAYDNDNAGIKASERAIGLLEKLDLKVKVLRLSGAKDPDEFIRKRGADAFRSLLEGSEDQIDYRLNTISAKYDLSVDEQKVSYLKEATSLVAALPGEVTRQVYAIRIASVAGIGQDAVVSEVERIRKRLLSKAKKDNDRALTRPERQAQPNERELHYNDPVSAAAEEGVIRLLYLDPSLIQKAALPSTEEFSSEVLGRIFRILKEKIVSGETISPTTLSAELSPAEMSLLVNILQKPEQLSSGEQSLSDYIQKIYEQKELSSKTTDLRALADKLRERKGYNKQ